VPEVGLSLATQYWGGRHHHNASKRMLCYVCTNKPIYVRQPRSSAHHGLLTLFLVVPLS
jgi:hypothetical protein